MSTRAVLCGLRRGSIEFGNSVRTAGDLGYYLIGTGVLVAVLYLNRNTEIEGTGLSLSQFILPGALAFVVFLSGTYSLATVVTTEREDGTLLRMKALPWGTLGYVVGQVTRACLEVLFSLALILTATLVLIDGLWGIGVRGAALVVVFVLLGLMATVPLGFIVGSVFRNPRSVGGWGFLVVGAVTMVSGVFAPLQTAPVWMQTVGQALPLYWLGLGMRQATLPDSAVAAEIGESWRTLETFAVLGGWAVAGLVIAPVLLRRMARRESGSSVAERRQQALQRV